jgi:hypothetical protein
LPDFGEKLVDWDGIGKRLEKGYALDPMAKNPAISVVSFDPIDPPRPLGTHGQALWDRIQGQYAISDEGGLEVLLQVCSGLDRAEELAALIARDGLLLSGNGGCLRPHPAIAGELKARAFVVASLQKLGINVPVVPARGPGRPPRL